MSCLEDWEYTPAGSELSIPRPNHGLAHALRTAAYVPIVVQFYVEHMGLNSIEKVKLEESIPWLQMVMLFFVSGRTNEAGWNTNPILYTQFRQWSMDAFKQFFIQEKNKGLNDPIVDLYAIALRDCYTKNGHIYNIIKVCHDLDLLRCYTVDAYEGKCLHIQENVGLSNILKLKKLALDAMIHTGDRIMGNAENIRGYGSEFSRSSTDYEYCMTQINNAIVKWKNHYYPTDASVKFI